MTCFAIGAPGDLWNVGLGQFNDLYYDGLYKNNLTDNLFSYRLQKAMAQRLKVCMNPTRSKDRLQMCNWK